MKTHLFVALSVTSVSVSGSLDDDGPAGRQLVGIGLLAALVSRNRWRFINRAAAIGAGDPVGPLLQWLTEQLPSPATLITWQLDSHVMPILIDAAADTSATVARGAMDHLAAALRKGPVDLAIDHGGATAPPLVAIAADHGIGTSIITDEERTSHWAFGETARLRADAADDALGLWRLFLRMANGTAVEAEFATEDWLRRRRRIRAVPSSQVRERWVRKWGDGKSPASSNQGE